MSRYTKLPSDWFTTGNGRALRGDAAAVHVAMVLRAHHSGNMIGLYHLALPTIAHETGISGAELDRVIKKLDELGEAHLDAKIDLVWIPDLAENELGSTKLHPADKRHISICKTLAPIAAHPFALAFRARYGESLGLPAAPPRKGATSPLGREGGGPSEGGPLRPSEPPTPPHGSQEQEQEQEHEQNQEQEHEPGQQSSRRALAGSVGDEVSAVHETGDPVVLFLFSLRDEGHPWGTTTAARVSKRPGFQLTPGERAGVEAIQLERQQPERRGTPARRAAMTPEAVRAWTEYRAALAIRGHIVRDAPSVGEMNAAQFVADQAAEAAAEENARPGRRGPEWTPELAEADFLGQWCDASDARTVGSVWALPLIRGAISRYALKGRNLPTQTAAAVLKKRESRRATEGPGIARTPAPAEGSPTTTAENREQTEEEKLAEVIRADREQKARRGR